MAASSQLKWCHTPASIAEECQAIIAHSKAVLDGVAAAAAAPTWATVVQPLARLDAELEARTSSVTFLKDVSVDEAVRAAAADAQQRLSAYEIEAGVREDVYAAFRAYAEAHADEVARMPAEERRFIEKTLLEFKRRGLSLPKEQREELTAVRQLISDRCIAYQQALGEWKETLRFTRAQLAGLQDDFVESLKKLSPEGTPADAEELEVTLSYPHVVPILRLAKVPATRAAVEKAFNSRGGAANARLLEEVVTLRRYEAQLLGYASHAAFVLEERMAKTPETVDAFLARLRHDLLPLHQADLASLTALKAAEEGGDAGPLGMADYRFYAERELESKFSVDHVALQPYFPLGASIDAMLSMYQRIFSAKFVKAEPGVDGAPRLWHPEATLFAVYDDSGALPADVRAAGWADQDRPEPGTLLGHFALDLHPRDGKYGHAAVFPLVSGCQPEPGKPRTLPFCAMLCNFPKPTPAAPALLRHDDFITLLHELGHVLHHIFSRTRLHRFSSFRLEQDAVEAPSQMLENFGWAPELLPKLARHHSTGEPLPADLAGKLAVSRIAHAGLLNTRQVFLASLDMRLHTLPAIPPPVSFAAALKAAREAAGPDGSPSVEVSVPDDTSTERLLDELHEAILGIPRTPGTNFLASFGHLVGGYSSGYYGYSYSEVFSADMFATVFEGADEHSGKAAGGGAAVPTAERLLDPVSGYRYRSSVLAPGGARDAGDSVREVLGREPSTAAFLRSKGLKS